MRSSGQLDSGANCMGTASLHHTWLRSMNVCDRNGKREEKQTMCQTRQTQQETTAKLTRSLAPSFICPKSPLMRARRAGFSSNLKEVCTRTGVQAKSGGEGGGG